MQAVAHLAPFRLRIEHVPPEAYSVHRWRIESRLDAPYTVTVVIHVLKEFASFFGRKAARPVRDQWATFELQAQANTFEPIHGRVSQCAFGHDELDMAHPWGTGLGSEVTSCTLTIRPRLWWASLAQTSRSFQRLSAVEVVRQVLQTEVFQLGPNDVELRLNAPLKGRRYRQQFQESDLAFVSRTLEREGLMYFFEQGADREVMVITDDASGYSRPPQWSGVRFVGEAGLATFADSGLPTDSPASGNFLSGWNQVITRFELERQIVSTDHGVDDYNYRSAGLGLNADRPGTEEALGQHSSYGVHAKTPDEATLRARQQKERVTQHAVRGTAWSTLTALAPGQTIGIIDGPADAVGRWLVLAVQSWGDRATPYLNRTQLQPEAVPYRPEWDTPLPEMAGFTHMRLDTTHAANPYARLDQHGRYLAWHYFEHLTGQAGAGSAPLRLVRDYAGPNYGQHFPVHAGVEALAGYVHGDPDRPVLLGIVHDSRNPNHVTGANAGRHVVRTWANNKLRMEDEPGQEHVKLSTEYGLSQLNLGQLVNQDRRPRGEGFELRTDHEGALRAEQGWLVSTARTNVRGDPKGEGHQLHLQPLLEQMQGVRPWADNRSKAATQVGLDAASSLKAADQFENNLSGLKTPIQASFSPSGIVYSAARNLAFGAERTQGFYALGPINLSCGEPFGVTAKKGIRLHAESGGIRHVVSSGNHTVHVQDGDWSVLAKESVMFESKSGVVRLQTKGGRYFVEVGPNGFRTNASKITELAGAKIDFTGGPVSGKAGASAGSAGALDYFGKMKVEDICIECLVKAHRAGSPFVRLGESA